MRTAKHLHLVAGVAALGMLLAACSAPENTQRPEGEETAAAGGEEAGDEIPETPSEPVDLTIHDVGGVLKLVQGAIEDFAADNPDVIASVTFETGASPDLVGSLKPQIDTDNLQIDMVLTGNDALSAGLGEDLWIPIAEEYGDRLGNMDNYIPQAADMSELAQGHGVLLSWTPGGPLLSYNPEQLPEADVPSTPEELLEWAEANPGKFGYARPANSGPGRTWLQGLPYMLGDSDPRDPENGWENTWAFLKELDQYVTTYPTGTGQVITNMSDGTWALTPITMGWDIEPRADGRAPNTLTVAEFDEYTFISDSHFAVVPQGQTPDKISAILLLLNDLLTPEQNAKLYDNGYHYPGPAIEGATLDLAPEDTQAVIEEFSRDWYDEAIESHEAATQLDAAAIVTAFDIWDREVGAGKFEAN